MIMIKQTTIKNRDIMRFVFDNAARKSIFLHHVNIRLPENKTGWRLDGQTYATPDEWLHAVQSRLFSLGIDQVECCVQTPKNTDAALIGFFFKKEIDSLQFTALVFGNRKGPHSFFINSISADRSFARMESVHKFCIQYGIKAYIYPINEFNFEVMTWSLYDHLSLKTQAEKGTFDIGLLAPSPDQKLSKTKIPRLFLSPTHPVIAPPP